MRGSLLGLALVLIHLLCVAPSGAEETEPAPRTCQPVSEHGPAFAAICIRQDHYFLDTCRAIEIFARRERLPVGYFARLIWQESRFDPLALSTAGAQGIAQFIPSTARLRGLRNPFDPLEALAKSAAYLRFLADKYGNLGLAAVAYNGGEARAARYVAAAGYLPAETRWYVEVITGLTPDAWLAGDISEPDLSLSRTEPFVDACVKMARAEAVPQLDRAPGEWMPWGVMLAQNFSQAAAIRRFERVQQTYGKVIGGEKLLLLMARNPSFGPRLRHMAMIGRQTREEAEALCDRLNAAGGACVVRKN